MMRLTWAAASSQDMSDNMFTETEMAKAYREVQVRSETLHDTFCGVRSIHRSASTERAREADKSAMCLSLRRWNDSLTSQAAL